MNKSSIKKVNESIISVWTKNILAKKQKQSMFQFSKEYIKHPKILSRLSYYNKVDGNWTA